MILSKKKQEDKSLSSRAQTIHVWALFFWEKFVYNVWVIINIRCPKYLAFCILDIRCQNIGLNPAMSDNLKFEIL